MRKLKKGDDVVVIAGRDKGEKSTISRILDNDRAIVDNVNRVKKHQKANPNAGMSGGIIDMEAPIHISNLAILNRETGKADRVGFKIGDDGKKVRIYKSSGATIDA
ncbi:50S ribosomal protein L24 [Ectothiorhodospiraceae bacterium BW-2]|nr:50S ribosomal protein L24 [Ectothiorhodospiraceae bacterium BW-2]